MSIRIAMLGLAAAAVLGVDPGVVRAGGA